MNSVFASKITNSMQKNLKNTVVNLFVDINHIIIVE